MTRFLDSSAVGVSVGVTAVDRRERFVMVKVSVGCARTSAHDPRHTVVRRHANKARATRLDH